MRNQREKNIKSNAKISKVIDIRYQLLWTFTLVNIASQNRSQTRGHRLSGSRRAFRRIKIGYGSLLRGFGCWPIINMTFDKESCLN